MSRTRTITLTLGSVAAGAILATGVTGLALADDASSPSAGTSSSTTASPNAGAPAAGEQSGDRPGGPGMGRHGGPGMGRHGGPLGGEALHAEAVVKAADGTISTVRQVRGTVTAVSASSITVEAEDGYTATFAVTADTEVHVGLPQRGVDPSTSTSTIADVSVGDVAHVHGTVADGTATATHLMAMTAEQAAQLEAERAAHEAEHQARDEARDEARDQAGDQAGGQASASPSSTVAG